MAEENATKTQEFEYLSPPILPSEHSLYREETFKEKLMRKCRENPFIPIGLSVTTFALTFGIWQMRTGNKVMSQRMMRLRVVAQGFTVFALLGGVAYNTKKTQSRIPQGQQ